VSNDNNNPNALSTEDVKFLRWAYKQSRASLYVVWTPSTQEGYVKVDVEVRRTDVPGADVIYTAHQRVLPLGRGWVERYVTRNDGPCTYSALDMHTSMRSVPTGVVLNLLDVGVRAGDTLAVHFQIGNDSDNLRNAGLSHDLCFLTLERNGDARGQFHMDDRIHRLGDSAGMEHVYVAPPTVTVVTDMVS